MNNGGIYEAKQFPHHVQLSVWHRIMVWWEASVKACKHSSFQVISLDMSTIYLPFPFTCTLYCSTAMVFFRFLQSLLGSSFILPVLNKQKTEGRMPKLPSLLPLWQMTSKKLTFSVLNVSSDDQGQEIQAHGIVVLLSCCLFIYSQNLCIFL